MSCSGSARDRLQDLEQRVDHTLHNAITTGDNSYLVATQVLFATHDTTVAGDDGFTFDRDAELVTITGDVGKQLQLRYDASNVVDLRATSGGDMFMRLTGSFLSIESSTAGSSANAIFAGATGSTSTIYFDVSGASVWTLTRGALTHNLIISDESDERIKVYQGTGNIAFGSAIAKLFWSEESEFLTITGDTAKQLRLAYDGSNQLDILTNSSGYTIFDNNGARYGFEQTSPQATVHVTQATVGNEILRLDSTATNDDPVDKWYHGRAATTDATTTTINTIAISANNTYLIEARVRARRTGGTAGTADDAAAYIVRGTYKTAAGAVTLVGALTAEYTAEDVAGYDATLAISATNVLVRVTGVLDTQITWHSTVHVENVGS